MNNRNPQSDYSAGPTTALNFVQNEAQIVFSGTEGDQYVVIATTCINSDIGNALEIGVEDNNAASTLHETLIRLKDNTTDYYSCPMIFLYTVPAGGAVDIGLYGFESGANVTLRNSSMCMFKLGARDVINNQFAAAGNTTPSTSFVAVTDSITTFNVDVAGDYLVLATASTQKDTTSHSSSMRLSIAGATSCDVIYRMVNLANSPYWPYAAIKKATLSAGSNTIQLEHKVTTSGTALTAWGTIVALRIDDLPKVHYNETASASTLSETYVENTNIEDDYRLNSFTTFLLSYGIQGRSGANVESRVKSTYDGTTLHETSYESVAAASQSKMIHFGLYPVMPTAGDHTIEQYLAREVVGLSTTTLDESAIAAIMLADNATIKVLGGKILGGQLL